MRVRVRIYCLNVALLSIGAFRSSSAVFRYLSALSAVLTLLCCVCTCCVVCCQNVVCCLYKTKYMRILPRGERRRRQQRLSGVVTPVFFAKLSKNSKASPTTDIFLFFNKRNRLYSYNYILAIIKLYYTYIVTI